MYNYSTMDALYLSSLTFGVLRCKFEDLSVKCGIENLFVKSQYAKQV